MKTKKVGNGVETTTYSYNIQSHITEIKGTKFSENLYYNSNTANLPNFTPCYNGNIAGIKWNVASENLGYQRAYSFDYDDLNRLTNSAYSGNNSSGVVSGTLDKYSEKLDYQNDKMGNLQGITRYENGALVENLSLSYIGNQLQNVDNDQNHFVAYGSELFCDYDKHIAIPREYAYDTNGNMLFDANGGVSDIEYNVLNLPDKIQFTEGHRNQYTYDAGGQKLKVENYTVNNVVNVPLGTVVDLPTNSTDYTKLTTDYVGNMIYQNGVLKEILLPEGYCQNGTFHYFLKDHLGNNRVTINSNGEVVEKSHYYPSGTRFYTESTSNSTVIPYRYNAKEMETMNGLNQMDYGARRRFAGLPIWTGRDPLSEKYYGISPYSYCAGNFPNAIDFQGKLIIFINGQHANNRMDEYHMHKYWGAIEQGVKDHFNDKNTHFIDGSLGGFLNTFIVGILLPGMSNTDVNNRIEAGRAYGRRMAAEWIHNLRRNKSGVIVEPFRIVSHSMGGAYAQGLAESIVEYVLDNPELCKGFKLSEYDFDPFQAGSLTPIEGDDRHQYIHKNKNQGSNSGLANQREQGLDNEHYHDNPEMGDHAISSFASEINNLPEGHYIFDGTKFVKQ